MGAILAEWGLEILFGLISAIVLGYAKYKGDKLKKELDKAKELTKEKKEYVINLLTTYGLKDFIYSYPNNLSGGMRQRVVCI